MKFPFEKHIPLDSRSDLVLASLKYGLGSPSSVWSSFRRTKVVSLIEITVFSNREVFVELLEFPRVRGSDLSSL